MRQDIASIITIGPFYMSGKQTWICIYGPAFYETYQIQSVKNFSNIVVVEMHAGSEYSPTPGSDYDSIEFPERFESLKNKSC